MSEHQTPARFQIAPDPQTAHLPLDHPIRRRSLLLSLAGAAALQACGGEVVGSGEEAEDAAALADEGLTKAATQAATANPAVPYAWSELVPMNMFTRTPLPVMDGCGLLSFNGSLWLIGGWWPFGLRVVRKTDEVTGLQSIVRDKDGNVTYSYGDFYSTTGFIKQTTNAVWRSADGITWDNVKPDTYNTDGFNPALDWAGRHAFGCVVFKNRMWIIGGDTQHIGLDLPSPLTSENYSETRPPIQDLPAQNDIWSSADGVTWRKEGNLPFVHKDMSKSTRHVHSVIAFNNALWLMGGASENYTYLNDVWKSTDGKTWTRVLAHMPNPQNIAVGAMGRWKPRELHGQVVVHNNRMWLLGGKSADSYPYLNDVWSTADGINWRLELANDNDFSNVSRWMGRFYAQTASFDGRLWIFTGVNTNYITTHRYPFTWECRQGETPPPGCEDAPDHGNQKDVWYSTDGKQWTKYGKEMIDPRHAAAAVVHGNALVVATGGKNDCWMLSPYVWERVPQRLSPHFGVSAGGNAVAVSNNSATLPRMWLLGADNGNISNAVWSTTDGGNWTKVKSHSNADWPGRFRAGAVFFNNRIWVIGGGTDGPVYLDDVWSSADGKTWRREATGLACLKRVFHSVAVFQGKMWIFGGQNTWGGLNHPTPEGKTVYYSDVWNSSDGKTWTRVTANAPWAGRGYTYGSAVFNNRLWVMGGGRYSVPGVPEVNYNDVWSTADGVKWTQHTAKAPWRPRMSHQVFVFDKRLWVAGGWNYQHDSGYGPTHDVWYSSDGANWAQLPIPGNDVPGGDSAIALLGGVPHLIGGHVAGGAASPTDVWRLKRRDGKV